MVLRHQLPLASVHCDILLLKQRLIAPQGGSKKLEMYSNDSFAAKGFIHDE